MSVKEKNKLKCGECGEKMVRIQHEGVVSDYFCLRCEIKHLGKLQLLQAEIEKLKGEKSLQEWADMRRHKSKSFPLDYSAAIADLGAVEIDYDTHLQFWRVIKVQEAISRVGRNSSWHVAMVENMLWHVYGEGRMLDSFRGMPTGANGPRLVESEMKAVHDALGVLLETATDRPAKGSE
jgi:hypothetical protein